MFKDQQEGQQNKQVGEEDAREVIEATLNTTPSSIEIFGFYGRQNRSHWRIQNKGVTSLKHSDEPYFST
jgi:hypothetical protein